MLIPLFLMSCGKKVEEAEKIAYNNQTIQGRTDLSYNACVVTTTAEYNGICGYTMGKNPWIDAYNVQTTQGTFLILAANLKRCLPNQYCRSW
jgi:hypothetical protein